ncbi:hypothetical protein GN958_ATG06570 [Phytophthora infestans]|uniref:Uncharacterized protein n=1 Tax=Phytophthora infestans TaxID=4787 RepID=A0A8S9US83_PHYIN|nr:hypothetical protein GN958_ATG08621 [Phytophthora infestans]KAF4144249.1 hypothetical protein GN958_ATG06570 [Phytophthora infestans]
MKRDVRGNDVDLSEVKWRTLRSYQLAVGCVRHPTMATPPCKELTAAAVMLAATEGHSLSSELRGFY